MLIVQELTSIYPLKIMNKLFTSIEKRGEMHISLTFQWYKYDSFI